MTTLEQERAAFAWRRVGPNPDDKYVNLAKGAPALVMTNGLLQVMGYLVQKADEHKKLARAIAEWLHERKIVGHPDPSGCIEDLMGLHSRQYMRATEETLEILRWIRTLAAARAKNERDGE